MAITPATPTPWIDRPVISAKPLDTPHMIAPRLKRVNAIGHSGLRPKTPENVAKHGWKMVVVRNEVSAQKASTAEPWMSWVITYFVRFWE
jgi:hypothetical protein